MASVRSEKSKLVDDLATLQDTNKDLQKQMEEFTLPLEYPMKDSEVQSTTPEADARHSSLTSPQDKSWDVDSGVSVGSLNDLMEVPRMRRRLVQMENELKRTRTKLLNSQSTLKVKYALWESQ